MKKQAGILLALAAAFTLAGCGYSPEEAKAMKEKQRTAEVAQFKENGFEIVGTLSEHYRPSIHATNCYTLKKIPDNGVTYQACITHHEDRKPSIYSLQALEKGLGR